MKVTEIIEAIANDMVCANGCPAYHKSHYKIEECNCYKREAIEAVKSIQSEKDNLRVALRKYGKHLFVCKQALYGTNPCDCGFEQALESDGG